MAIALLSGGCTFSSSGTGGIDYRSASEAGPSLEVPPDLTAPAGSDRFAVPDVDPKGSATFSTYSSERAEPARAASDVRNEVVSVASEPARMHIERSGSQRWLVVQAVPDALWPKLREFWIELGFVLNRDEPNIGIMETDWAEDRAKIPQDFIRNTLGRVIDNVYSTPERDKFRTRLEAGREAGATEIFISHRGMIEIYPDEAQDRTIWQPRPADPELEAEMLRRLMVKLGQDEGKAQAAVAAAPDSPERARIESNESGSRLIVSESFERAWRRVGLALDRTGFTVEDRDRSQGVYYVRYVDPEADNAEKPGFLSKLAFWRSSDDQPKGGDRFRIRVAGEGEQSVVSVLSLEGGEVTTPTAKRIVTVLHEQLR